jgi:hypothetical protein
LVVRTLVIVGLAVLFTTGLASPATVDRRLVFAIELEASQTLSWSVDQKVVAGPFGCLSGGSSWDFVAPARGSGEMTWRFSASTDRLRGRRLKAPARGSVQGTYGLLETQGRWEPSSPPQGCLTDFPRQDRLEPTSGCGPFASKGWADVWIEGGKLLVEAGIYHDFVRRLRCPFIPEGAGREDGEVTPFNFMLTSAPVSQRELSSGKVIRRTKRIDIVEKVPLPGGETKTRLVNTWTVTLIPAGALLAVPEASEALRGETATLDGSKSKGRITSYVWTFRAAAGCGNVGTKAGAKKTGKKAVIKVLCPVAAKLTVSDGSNSDSATVTVPVTPRTKGFTTPPVKHEELLRDDRVSDPPFVHPGANYGIKLGLNVAACDERSTGQPMLCPPPRVVGGKSTGLGNRYTFARVDDRGGPFDGFSYVATAPLTIERIGILNYWVLPGAPRFVANQPNFWDYNSTTPVVVGGTNKAVDLAGMRAAMSAHEGKGLPGQLSTGHSGRLQAWIKDEDSDPRRLIEDKFKPDEKALQQLVDQKLAAISTELFVAMRDPLPVIWRGEMWFYDREDSVWRQEDLTIGG